jgi:hypothetical protein
MHQQTAFGKLFKHAGCFKTKGRAYFKTPFCFGAKYTFTGVKFTAYLLVASSCPERSGS